MIKFLYVIFYILAAIPILGYARYLCSKDKNIVGAAVVLLLVLVTGIALWQGEY